ncbi:MAG: branched-chain amino acid ABC transporter permease [Chloroflexota bacterium]|nr:branched-chain amino acid ABC transporter permease [Chloroflexota bacterium]
MDKGRVITFLAVSAITAGVVGISANDAQSLGGFISFLTVFITTVAIFAIFALGLNVQWGYTGIFNFGIVAFFMVGAYTSALLTKEPSSSQYVRYVGGLNLAEGLGPLGLDGLTGFVLGALAAAVVSGLVAFLIAIPALRLREDYLAIATIGVAEVFRRIAIEEEGLVNGTRGLTGIPRPLHDLVSPPDYKYVYLAIAVVILFLIFIAIERSARSPWGRVLKAIREDELTTAASGKNIFSFRTQAFVLGAMIMGIGGAVYSANQGAIVPDTFSHFFGTFIIWAMLMVGGSGSNRGAILGAYVVWGFWTVTGLVQPHLPEALEARTSYIRDLLIGLLIIVVLLLRPNGLMGEERRVSLFMRRETNREARRVGAPTRSPEE